MPRRIERSPEELERELAGDADLRRIYDSVFGDDRLEVYADGEQSCVFKVYLRGRTGANEGFVRAKTPIDRTYIHWARQPAHCKHVFAGLVREAGNTDGSQLRPGTTAEQLIEAIREYATSTETDATT